MTYVHNRRVGLGSDAAAARGALPAGCVVTHRDGGRAA